MKNLGPFKRVEEPIEVKVDLNTLKPGINSLKDFIVKLNELGEVVYVITKICDHAGGKLIVKEECAVCPLHGWELNLNTLKYNNSHENKKPIKYTLEKNILTINSTKGTLINENCNTENDHSFTMQWLNHASIEFRYNDTSLITDPWLCGPAFLGGWWLEEPSLKSSIDKLVNANYVYISHNHPDHLHPETLRLLSRETTILSPKFTSRATSKYLTSLGFTNIKELEFNHLYELEPGFTVSILKSGDFRDDSGLYLQLGNRECLLTVDSNYLNSGTLPSDIDILLTSFAGGASGFPLIYQNFNNSDKDKILRRNANSIKAGVLDYLNKTRPKYYHPYAGMFDEKANRDSEIKLSNVKNTIESYVPICESKGITLLSPDKRKVYCFDSDRLTIKEDNSEYLPAENTHVYLKSFRDQNPLNLEEILTYMSNSNYHGDQIVNLIPTNDNFDTPDSFIFCDFSQQYFTPKPIEELDEKHFGKRTMTIKIRSEILMMVINNKMPWEDFSIGFQARITRFPNTYESEFWYHFTNKYINDRFFKFNQHCGACKLIDQNPKLI